MRLAWSVLLLLAAACAGPTVYQSEIQISPRPSPRGAFHVEDYSGEPETRRYRIKPEELMDSDATAKYDVRPSDGARHPGNLAPGMLAEAVGVIRTMMPPGAWDHDARLALYVERDEIVARHTPAVLAQVERLLETLKAHRNTRVTLRVQFLTIPIEEMGVIRHLPATWEGLGGVIDRREIETLMKTCIPQRMSLTMMPRLTLFHGQAGVVTMASRFPYLKGAEPKATDYSAVIDEVSTGLKLSTRVVADGPQSDRFLVHAAVEVQDLASFTSLRLGDHVVQVPAVLTRRSAGPFVLGPDQAAVLLGPPARALNGLPGSLGSTASEPGRMTLYLLAVDRAE